MASQTLLVLAIATAVALSSLPPLALLRASRVRLALAAAAIWLVAAASFAWAAARFYPPLPDELANPDRPIQDLRRGYVSSKACQACHPHEYDAWHASYHRTMTQVATPQSVAASFDDVTIELRGRKFHLEQRGQQLWVEMDDPGWTGPPEHAPRVERRIVLTTGSHHDQNYWYATPGPGRDIALLPIDFRVRDQRWVPFASTFLHPPQPEFVVPKSSWTQTCVKCHATYGERDRAAATQHEDSRVAEFGIACEACHGPGAEHAAANRNPQHRYQLHLGDETDPTIQQPAKLANVRSAEVCGQCHGVWSERWQGADLEDYAERYKPGDVLEHHRIYQQFGAADPAYARFDDAKHQFMKTLFERESEHLMNVFWPDGMVRVSGREYTGLIESPCYRGGEFTCLSCHTMHQPADDPRPRAEWADDQLTDGKQGNGGCLQCHSEFTSATSLSAHTHHAPESTGSNCYNCHMPFTSYGILKAHRSHEVDSPSVAATLETTRPNACNACHLDQTLAWTADLLASRYGIARPALDRDQRAIAASVLWALRGDAGQRVLAAWYMGWEPAIAASGSDWMIPYLSELMADPYDAVRYVAGRALGHHPGYADVRFDYVADRAQIDAARAELGRRWSAGSRAARGPAVLQGDGGRLDEPQVRRLLAARDERLVELHE